MYIRCNKVDPDNGKDGVTTVLVTFDKCSLQNLFITSTYTTVHLRWSFHEEPLNTFVTSNFCNMSVVSPFVSFYQSVFFPEFYFSLLNHLSLRSWKYYRKYSPNNSLYSNRVLKHFILELYLKHIIKSLFSHINVCKNFQWWYLWCILV